MRQSRIIKPISASLLLAALAAGAAAETGRPAFKTASPVDVVDEEAIRELPSRAYDILETLPVMTDDPDYCEHGSALVRGIGAPGAWSAIDRAPFMSSSAPPPAPPPPPPIEGVPATAVATETTDENCNDGEKRDLAYHYVGDQEDVALGFIESVKAGMLGSSGYTDLDDLEAKITAALTGPIDPNGMCRDCIQSITLYQHGYPNAFAISGSHFFRAERDDDSLPPELRSDARTMAFMAFLKARMCTGGRVVFWSCSIACGEGGKQLGQAVADYLGVEVKAPNKTQTLFYDSVDDADDVETFTPR